MLKWKNKNKAAVLIWCGWSVIYYSPSAKDDALRDKANLIARKQNQQQQSAKQTHIPVILALLHLQLCCYIIMDTPPLSEGSLICQGCAL